MQDDLERTGESAVLSSTSPPIARLETLDVVSAIGLAEEQSSTRLIEGGAALDEAFAIASRGERVAVIASSDELASRRGELRRFAQARLGIVVHALASHGNEDLGSLLDLGMGVLCSAGPEDAFDLSLVARRAAEDSGVPFLIVHAFAQQDGRAGRAIATVGIPQEKALKDFVGGRSRLKAANDPSHPSMTPHSDRSFAERAPFALGSALREYGAVSGRRRDVFDKLPLGEAPLVLVGMGAVGDGLASATNELRALGYEVAGIQVAALRPFPGARLIKALARTLAVTVLEAEGEPLSSSGPLSRELKSAFTDAITWVPGFPGIGRIPKLFTGASGASLDISDLAAICENMLADERGQRGFALSDPERGLPAAPPPRVPTDGPLAFRAVLDDEATAEAVIASATAALSRSLGLRVSALLTREKSGGATVDLFASRGQARGGMVRRPARLVLATAGSAPSVGAIGSVAPGGILVVVGAGAQTAAAVPDGARAIARDRRARILPIAPAGAAPAAFAAVCAGAAVAVASRTTSSGTSGAELERLFADELGGNGDSARRAFEAVLDAASAQDREGNGAPPAIKA